MPNPYHYRAHIDRLTRLTEGSNPGYIRLRAVIALLRELSPANPRSAANNRLLHSVDPFDLARHKLRDLYDHTQTSPLGGACPAPDAGGAPHACGAEGAAPAQSEAASGSPTLTEDDSSEEDDDPL